MTKGTFRTVAITLLMAFLAFGTGAAEANQFVTIATGGTAGVYYPLGGAMAQLINEHVAGVTANAQSTGASVANVNLLAQGEVELALIQNDIAFYAATGTEMFANRQVASLRGVASLYPETIQIVTREDTGIESIPDLAGKRVAVGAPGSGTEANARQILAAYGLSYDDIRADFLSFAEAADNLRDRAIDAAFLTAGFPTAAVTDIAASHAIRILEVSQEMYEKLAADYPFYTSVTIPAGTYSGQDSAVSTVAVLAMLATTSDLGDDVGYEITKAIFDHTDYLARTHSVGQLITAESALDGMPLDLHPGAQRYFGQ